MNVSGFQNTIAQTLSTSQAVRAGAVTVPDIEAPQRVSDIVAKAFIRVERKVPTLELTSAAAGFRVNADAEFLDAKFRNPSPPSDAVLDKNPNLAASRLDALGEIRISLEKLGDTVKNARSSDTLTTRSASSNRPELVQVAATQSSPVGSISVLPQKVSANNVLVSDVQAFPFAPLGQNGSFVVNGVKVMVLSTDTIIDLRDKINYGEDANHNGRIDGAEDLNGNGVADVINVNPSKSGPGVYVVEDANGNGRLDAAEDANDNKKLDGGTQENKVVASIQRNRLVITSATGGSSSIDLQDTDNILLSIGFYERNSKGLPIQKETQIDFSKNPPEALLTAQDTAQINLGGKTVVSDSNDFSGAIPGTYLKIKRASDLDARVDIVNDPDKAARQIGNIVDKFNAAIRDLNSVLVRTGLFDKDFKVQNIRNDLVNAAEPTIREAEKANNNIDGVDANRQNQKVTGLKVINPEKNVVQEMALTSAVNGIKDGLTLPFKSAGNDLLQRLSTVGIKTASDDTIKVDEAELKKALAVNTGGVRDIFNNPDTGLLPQLDRALGDILRRGVGDLDIKRDEVLIHSKIPSALAEKFQRFVDNATLRNKIQNLIAVA